MFYDPDTSQNGIMKSINKVPKKQRIEDMGTLGADQMIFNPTEILDEKQREWEAKNPDWAAREPDREIAMKPEFYEEALDKMRERKAALKQKEK